MLAVMMAIWVTLIATTLPALLAWAFRPTRSMLGETSLELQRELMSQEVRPCLTYTRPTNLRPSARVLVMGSSFF